VAQCDYTLVVNREAADEASHQRLRVSIARTRRALQLASTHFERRSEADTAVCVCVATQASKNMYCALSCSYRADVAQLAHVWGVQQLAVVVFDEHEPFEKGLVSPLEEATNEEKY